MSSTPSAYTASALFAGSSLAVLLRQRLTSGRRLHGGGSLLAPPEAQRKPSLQYFGRHPERKDEYRGEHVMDPPRKMVDYYQWLRDDERSNDEVLNYIKAENQYCESQMKPHELLTEQLYNEMLSYLKETDEDVPYRDGDYEYFSKTEKGLSYTIHCRRHISPSPSGSNSVVILDENKLVETLQTSYLDLGVLEPSPSHSLMAYAVDTSGYETYKVYIQHIPHAKEGMFSSEESSSEDGISGCLDVLCDTGGQIEWGFDDSCIFYTKMDDEHRPYQVWLHLLGTSQDDDILLFQEDDGLFNVSVGKTMSEKCMIISSESIETSEAHVIFLPSKSFSVAESQRAHVRACEAKVLVQKREKGLRYEVDHHGDSFLIVTNQDGAKNGKLVSVAVPDEQCIKDSQNPSHTVLDLSAKLSKTEWKEVRPYDPSIEITGVLPFRSHVAVFGREGGGQCIWIYFPHAGREDNWKKVSFDEECYCVYPSLNRYFDSTKLRVKYSSLVTPQQVIDIDMNSFNQEGSGLFSKQVLKQKEVPGYDPEQYKCCRLYAPSTEDGVSIPISIVFHKSLLPKGDSSSGLPQNVPLLMNGYGSYGCSNDPSFLFSLVPLLDRGIAFAIAHIRGGGEMGRALWYEEGGKYFTKMNTFHDFASCGKYLQQEGVSSKEQMAVVGRSAGGLLIGATINMYPDLFQAAVADVPFVDVLNTMSDPSIPLTVGEWEEWGNPNEEEFFNYMSKYCPYTNIRRQDYPALLITAGLFDPRVAYWEPAKFVCKLREHKTDTNVLLMKTDLSSGHFSASDRYKELRERAFEMTFVLSQISKQSL